MADKITVTWYGHSCFKAEANGYSIVIDPYEDHNVPGLCELRVTANQALCSHGHGDHNFTAGVETEPWTGENPWTISWIDTYHDDKQGELRGKNRIHILDHNGIRLVHMGDLGCDLTADQIKQIGKPDVLLIPVGGFYTIDAAKAKEISDLLDAAVTVPMHYRSEAFGYPVIGTLEEYTGLCSDVVNYAGNSIDIMKGIKKQTAVLSLC